MSFALSLLLLLLVSYSTGVIINTDGFVELCLNRDNSVVTILSLPELGTISLFTYNYLVHGREYRPMTTPSLAITATMLPFVLPVSSKNKILYQIAPYRRVTTVEQFEFQIEHDHKPSKLFILQPDMLVYMSLLDGWGISQKNVIPAMSHRGSAIYGSQFEAETNMWSFVSPLIDGIMQVAYGGYLQFTIESFAGDFSADNLRNDPHLPLVSIVSESRTLTYQLRLDPYSGGKKTYRIPLIESSWSQLDKKPISRESFIRILSGTNAIYILGDFTKWHEVIGLADFRIVGRGSNETNTDSNRTR